MAKPKGSTRKGGRRKVAAGKTTADSRERIENDIDPIGFLGRVVAGDKVDGETPTLAQRIGAAQYLGKKVIADLKSVEMSGALGMTATFEVISNIPAAPGSKAGK